MSLDLPLDLGDLTIRRLRHTDFADIRAIYSDPEVARYQDWEPMSDDQVQALLDGQGCLIPGDTGVPLILPVVLNTEERVIGDVVLTITDAEHRQAEVGFCFHPAYQGRGFATRAVRAVVGYAFSQIDVHRVFATTDVRNQRSWRLLERVGMRREGHLRECSYIKGEWVDDYVYAVLAEEWSEPALRNADGGRDVDQI
jgi:RimJ/RimL family protein N-acetyltransferase